MLGGERARQFSILNREDRLEAARTPSACLDSRYLKRYCGLLRQGWV